MDVVIAADRVAAAGDRAGLAGGGALVATVFGGRVAHGEREQAGLWRS